MVIRPVSVPSASTTSSFSMRCSWSSSLARSMPVPGGTVTRWSEVMTEETAAVVSFTKRRSRLVRMPTALPPRVTGKPEIL
jgi:hypothetical protein